MIEHGKVYVCAGCRVPAPLMFRIDGDRTMCRDCVKNCIAELEATIARVREVLGQHCAHTGSCAIRRLRAALDPTPEAPK